MEYKLETLEVYQMAEAFSDPIWEKVQQWDHFTKDTIGKQLVRVADSISANNAEGYGRYSIRKASSFIFMPEVLSRKRRHGFPNAGAVK